MNNIQFYNSNGENANHSNFLSQRHSSMKNLKQNTPQSSQYNPTAQNFKSGRRGSSKPNPIGLSKKPLNKNERSSKSPLHTRFGETEITQTPLPSAKGFFGKNSGLAMEYEPNFYEKQHSNHGGQHKVGGRSKRSNKSKKRKTSKQTRMKSRNKDIQKRANNVGNYSSYQRGKRNTHQPLKNITNGRKNGSYQDVRLQVQRRDVTYQTRQNIQQGTSHVAQQQENLLSRNFIRKPFKPKHPFLKKYFNEDGTVNFNDLSQATVPVDTSMTKATHIGQPQRPSTNIMPSHQRRGSTHQRQGSIHHSNHGYEPINLDSQKKNSKLQATRSPQTLKVKDSPFKNKSRRELKTFQRKVHPNGTTLSRPSYSPIHHSRSVSRSRSPVQQVFLKQTGPAAPQFYQKPKNIVTKRRIIDSSMTSNPSINQKKQTQKQVVQPKTQPQVNSQKNSRIEKKSLSLEEDKQKTSINNVKGKQLMLHSRKKSMPLQNNISSPLKQHQRDMSGNSHLQSTAEKRAIKLSQDNSEMNLNNSPSKQQKMENSKKKIQNLLSTNLVLSQNKTEKKELPKNDFNSTPFAKTIKNDCNPNHLKTIEEDRQNEKTCSSKKIPQKISQENSKKNFEEKNPNDDESEYSSSTDSDISDSSDNEEDQERKTKVFNEHLSRANLQPEELNPNKSLSQAQRTGSSEIQSTNFIITKNNWANIESKKSSMKGSIISKNSMPIQIQQGDRRGSFQMKGAFTRNPSPSKPSPTYPSSTSNLSPSQIGKSSIVTPTLNSTSMYSTPYGGGFTSEIGSSVERKQYQMNSMKSQKLNEFDPHSRTVNSNSNKNLIMIQGEDNKKESLIEMRFVNSQQRNLMQKKPSFNVNVNMKGNGEGENIFKTRVDESGFFKEKLDAKDEEIRTMKIENQKLLEENIFLKQNIENMKVNHQDYIKELEDQERRNSLRVNEEFKTRIVDLEKLILGLRSQIESLNKKKHKEKKKRKKLKNEFELEIKTRDEILGQHQNEISSLKYTINLLTIELQNSQNEKINESRISNQKMNDEILEEMDEKRNRIKVLEKKNRKLKKEVKKMRRESISPEDYMKSEKAFEELQLKVVALVKENNRLNSLINKPNNEIVTN